MITWMKATGLHTWLAESVTWFPYPTTLALHSMGMAIVAGVSVVVCLRLLGAAPELPLAPLKKVFPLIWLGFGINAVSGVGLFFADPDKLVNWVIWIKLAFVALAMVTVRMIQTRVFGNPNLAKGELAPSSTTLAWAAIVFWAGVIWAGRFSAYIGFE